ncbi:TetR/AcrR family transcriptional regulator, partial [Streptomyces sp. SID3343]|uniref:TetR/AcrR family transcriptional regulator n=1 Tax=Streptomyces sp. SID3343 TaxID=2690260 RepID=UPI001371DF79
DAAIALLASDGVRGLTHRAVEKIADVPGGTASNYFPTREALLVAAADRVAELHVREMESASRSGLGATRDTAVGTPDGVWDEVTTPALLADLLTESLLSAATDRRDRYLAVCELRLEAGRRPALASALSSVSASMEKQTQALHAELATPVPAFAIRTLIALYTGALFTLVTTPLDEIDAATVRGLAEAIVDGALPGRRNAAGTSASPTG